jgi:hypothetical protein
VTIGFDPLEEMLPPMGLRPTPTTERISRPTLLDVERGQNMKPAFEYQAPATLEALARHEGVAEREPHVRLSSPRRGGSGDFYDQRTADPWTHAGLPAMGLPAGTNAVDQRIGLQVTDRWQADEGLLACATEIAKAMVGA